MHESAVMMSSVIPSAKYSCSGSPASQVVTNLTVAHQQRLQDREKRDQMITLEDEFRRERDQMGQLHNVMMERLKAGYAADVDNLRANVAELEAQLRILSARNREGGN